MSMPVLQTLMDGLMHHYTYQDGEHTFKLMYTSNGGDLFLAANSLNNPVFQDTRMLQIHSGLAPQGCNAQNFVDFLSQALVTPNQIVVNHDKTIRSSQHRQQIMDLKVNSPLLESGATVIFTGTITIWKQLLEHVQLWLTGRTFDLLNIPALVPAHHNGNIKTLRQHLTDLRTNTA